MGTESSRHDPETIKLGLAKIAEIRAQLAERKSYPGQPSRTRPPALKTSGVRRPDLPVVETSAVLDDSWSAERIEAEMAAGGERDRLHARVSHLEAEVAQLRSALSAVLAAAARGLTDDTDQPIGIDHQV